MAKTKKQQDRGEIIIYQDKKRNASVEVRFSGETVWLTQGQITDLFGIDRTVVTKHIRNILKDGEVDTKSNVQKMHIPNSDKPVSFYNLDIILAVGYRTNTRRGIEFRRWATNVLKDHILKGVTVNEQRLKQLQGKQLIEFRKTLDLLERAKQKMLSSDETSGLLEVISGYANAWLLLQKYDEQRLETPILKKAGGRLLLYEDARSAIDELKIALMNKGEASDLFGSERDKSFQGIIAGLYQSFGGIHLYPSIEEKAAHLLYFVIKDHSFSDGNKRIGSFLFILFLSRNNKLLKKSGEKKINDNALVALALLIAESNPKEKEVMIRLILNLLAN